MTLPAYPTNRLLDFGQPIYGAPYPWCDALTGDWMLVDRNPHLPAGWILLPCRCDPAKDPQGWTYLWCFAVQMAD